MSILSASLSCGDSQIVTQDNGSFHSKNIFIKRYIINLIEEAKWDDIANTYKYAQIAERYGIPLWQDMFVPYFLKSSDSFKWMIPLPVPGYMFNNVGYAILDENRVVFAIIIDEQKKVVKFFIFDEKSNSLDNFDITFSCSNLEKLKGPIYMTGRDSLLFITFHRCDKIWKVDTKGNISFFASVPIHGYNMEISAEDRKPHYLDIFMPHDKDYLYVMTITHSLKWDSNRITMLKCLNNYCSKANSIFIPYDIQCGSKVLMYANGILGSGIRSAIILDSQVAMIIYPFSPVIVMWNFMANKVKYDSVSVPYVIGPKVYEIVDSLYSTEYYLKTCGKVANEPNVTSIVHYPGFFSSIGIVRGKRKHTVIAIFTDTIIHKINGEIDTIFIPFVYTIRDISRRLLLDGIGAGRFAFVPTLSMILGSDVKKISEIKIRIDRPIDFISANWASGYGNCFYLNRDDILCFALYPSGAYINEEDTTVILQIGDVTQISEIFRDTLSSFMETGKLIVYYLNSKLGR